MSIFYYVGYQWLIQFFSVYDKIKHSNKWIHFLVLDRTWVKHRSWDLCPFQKKDYLFCVLDYYRMMSTGNNLGCNKFREILFEKANKVPPFYLACHLEKEQNPVFNSLTTNQLKIIYYISTQNRIKGLNSSQISQNKIWEVKLPLVYWQIPQKKPNREQEHTPMSW